MNPFRRGPTAADSNLEVTTSWDEFVPDEDDGSDDGDDSIHSREIPIDDELLRRHFKETEG